MIIKTKVEGSSGGMRTTYYKYMGLNGKPTCGSKNQAAVFDEPTGKMVLAQLRAIDHRFAEAELVAG